MKRVEEEMLKLIAERRSGVRGDIEVITYKNSYWCDDLLTSDVRLHDNSIANIGHRADGTVTVVVQVGTLREYPTATTLSILRALCVDVKRRGGKIYLDGEYICDVK